MYLIPKIHIEIGKIILDYATDVEIKRTWKELNNTATIKLPRALKLKGRMIEDLIKHGDTVSISLGYEPGLTVEFEGYVSRIMPGIPVTIECEDEMYQLKRTNFTKSWESASLKTVVNYIAGSYSTEVLDAELGSFQINKANACQVLDHIKENYGISAFFRGKKLIVGFPYPEDGDKVKYHFQRNIVEGNDLKYLRKEDVKLKVKAISMQDDNKTVEVEVGDEGGDMKTLHLGYGLQKAELKKQAEAELDKLKVDGYTGTIQGFGIPYADHGDIAVLTDEEYPEREGEYYIESVVVKLGESVGFKRECEIGKRAG